MKDPIPIHSLHSFRSGTQSRPGVKMSAMIHHLLVCLLVLLARPVGAREASFSSRHSPAIVALAHMRGGAGPLNPTDTAKVATMLVGTQATLTLLSPRKTLEVYGFPEGVMMELLTGYQGAETLGFALQAYLLLFREADLTTAVAVSAIPRCLYAAKILWNEDYQTVGFSPVQPLLQLAFGTFVLRACLTDVSYVKSVVKVYAVWNILNGLVSFVLPGVSVKARKFPESEWHTLFMAAVGATVLGVGAYQTALAWEVDPLKAFSLAWAPFLLLNVKEMFITKRYDDLKVPKLPVCVWMIGQAVVLGTCGIGKHLVHHEGVSPI